MLKVENNEIYLTRGDEATLTLEVESDGQPYDFSGETVIFSLKRCPDDPKPLIQKTFVNGSVTLLPGDTDDLPFGQYLYDVTIAEKNATIITPTVFTVGCEVHS